MKGYDFECIIMGIMAKLGEKGSVKVPKEALPDVTRRFKEGESMYSIGRRYNVTSSTISNILVNMGLHKVRKTPTNKPKGRILTNGVDSNAMINQRAAGKSNAEIALATGYTANQVAKHIERPHIRELIKAEKNRLLEALPDVVEDQISNVRASKTLKLDVEDPNFHKVIKLKSLGQKSGEIILKASGILPTAAFQAVPNQTMVNVLQIRNIIHDQMTAPSDDTKDTQVLDITGSPASLNEDNGDNGSN